MVKERNRKNKMLVCSEALDMTLNLNERINVPFKSLPNVSDFIAECDVADSGCNVGFWKKTIIPINVRLYAGRTKVLRGQASRRKPTKFTAVLNVRRK